MPSEWIKVERATPDKPEVIKISRMLGIGKDSVVGKLIRLWLWFDQNTRNGEVTGVTLHDIDVYVDCPNFCDALIDVEWMMFSDVDERISITNFDVHNGESAKMRANGMKRQQKYRENQKIKRNGSVTPDASLDKNRVEVKRKEKKKRFTPPALVDVQSYIDEKHYSFQAEDFINFYTAKDWMIGKNKMVCWKSACAMWHRRGNQSGENSNIHHVDFEVPGI